MNGRWYVVNVYSGFERRVADAIKERSEKEGLSEFFHEVLIPTEKVTEVRGGNKVTSEQKFFPGYILVNMTVTDRSWHLVRSIPKVSNFLGSKGKPVPISQKEVDAILKQLRDGGVAQKKVSYDVGDFVKVMEGPFATFQGVVEEVDDVHNRMKVSISILGRSTKIDLEFSQIERV